MAKETIFEGESITVWYHPEDKIIHHKVLCFPRAGALRDALTAGADVVEKRGGRKWLSDDRAVAALPPEDLAWGAEVWTKRMLKLGWKHWAILQPEKSLGQLTLTRIAKLYGDMGVTVEFFSEEPKALNWLRSH